MSDTAVLPPLEFQPLTAARWPDLETLFGVRGACGGCWCMWWRVPRRSSRGRKAKKTGTLSTRLWQLASCLACSRTRLTSRSPGARSRRATIYPALDRSRILKRVDDAPVWSVTCLFVARPFAVRGDRAPA